MLLVWRSKGTELTGSQTQSLEDMDLESNVETRKREVDCLSTVFVMSLLRGRPLTLGGGVNRLILFSLARFIYVWKLPAL